VKKQIASTHPVIWDRKRRLLS